MSNHPAVKPKAKYTQHITGLATMSNHPAVKPVRAKPQAERRIGRLKRMKKRRYSCFIDPGRVVFPSDADLHRRRFPPQRRYSSLFAYWVYDTAAVLLGQRIRSSRFGRRLPFPSLRSPRNSSPTSAAKTPHITLPTMR